MTSEKNLSKHKRKPELSLKVSHIKLEQKQFTSKSFRCEKRKICVSGKGFSYYSSELFGAKLRKSKFMNERNVRLY